MNKEEIEAIEYLRKDIKFRKNNKWFENCIIEPKIAQKLLNLIDKLQKENKALGRTLDDEIADNDRLQKENEELDRKFRYAVPDEMIEELYVSKDKIREKLKKLRKEEDRISKLNYELEPEKAIDSLLLRIGDLEELLGDDE